MRYWLWIHSNYSTRRNKKCESDSKSLL